MKRYGFTLAETLLSLSIIVLVASFTIPTLIMDQKEHEFRSGYVRASNILNNAYSEYSSASTAQFERKYRDVERCPEGTNMYSLFGIKFCMGTGSGGLHIDPVVTQEPYLEKSAGILDPVYIGQDRLNTTELLMENLIKPYISVLPVDTSSATMAGCPASDVSYFYTSDGMKFCISYNASGSVNPNFADKTYGVVWVDVNGDKLPNMITTDSSRPGDTFPFVILKNRFVPGHPTVDAYSTTAQEVYFGKKS